MYDVFATADETGLGLTEADGKTRTRLALTKEGPELGFRDAVGKDRVGLSVSSDGPRLKLYDADGKLRAVLGRANLEQIHTGEETLTSEGSLVLFDKEGKVLTQLPR
jgi:hypothetical protein